jgi:uncharacterized protein with von Willebrand factor type A (vWA) domain
VNDGAVLERVLAQLETRRGDIGANLVQFAALLKAAEIDLTTAQLLSAAQSLAAIDITRRDDVRAALAASVITRIEDRPVFDALFDRFWRVPGGDEPPHRELQPQSITGGQARLGAEQVIEQAYARRDSAAARPDSDTPPRSYSAQDLLVQKDFATFRDDDVREARRYLRRLVPKLATATTRRRRSSRSGRDLDLRRSLRSAARRGGEIDRLWYRKRRIRRLNLVLLCDVSGSMDVYSRFLTQFIYGLQSELRGVSTFVFSTRLFDVTPMLRARSFEDALEQVARRVEGWSGGTRIGASLGEFQRGHAKQRVGPRTVVVIISDGWDRGDIAQLSSEMQSLRRRAYRILWLNPLLGVAGYQPLAQGMSAALSFVDEFLPVHNLESLARVGRTLIKLSRG